MMNCKNLVKITKRARILDVTPNDQERNFDEKKNGVEQELVKAEEPDKIVRHNTLADSRIVDEGRTVFKNCIACHEVGEGAKNGFGPHLNDLIGRKIAGIDNFQYSAVFREIGDRGGVWTESNLRNLLKNSMDFAPGTKMIFAGLKSDKDLASVIAYLKTHSAAPTLVSEIIKAPEVNLSEEVLAIKGDLEYGEYLANDCSTCHIASGTNSGIPKIVGMAEKEILMALHAYKRKIRDNSIMQMMAGRLSDEEIASVALYFSQLK